MNTEIVKLNPAEYGLKEDEVQPIEKAFMPKIVEREALKPMYEALITEELTPALCVKSKELRLKLVKVRTGIAEIHKTQKAYFLAAGRFVDAWKNKETLPVEQMEERLEAIEKHFENLEKERKQKIRDERLAELQKYEVDGSLMMLDEMQDDIWINYLAGVRLQFDAKKEAERKAEEARLAEIEAEKKRQEEIRLENERLKKEKDALQKKADAERAKQQAEIAAAEKARKDAEAKMLAQAKADRERLEAANAEREKAEAELKAKREADERAAKAEQERLQQEEIARQKAEKKAAAAPDKEKLLKFAETIQAIELPKLKTPEAAEISANVKTLLGKVNAYIIEKANNL
jgi:hypothetical protein